MLLQKQKKAASSHRDKRRHERYECSFSCTLRTPNRELRGECINISEGGAAVSLRSIGTVKEDTKLTLQMPDMPEIECVARWNKARTLGMQFVSTDDNFAALKRYIRTLI